MTDQPATPPQDPTPVQVSADASRRLNEQLHTLSRVVETLTYRLLDLEERVSHQADRFETLLERGPADAAASAADSEAAERRWQDTEERLLRIESMLAEAEHRQPGSCLSLVDARPQDIDGPFPEEPEQSFLDDHQIDAEFAEPTEFPEEDGEGPHRFLTA